MARPIKETPILYGKDSDMFLEAIRKNEKDTSKRVSREIYISTKKVFKKIMADAGQ